jgi:hypothetical protein
MARPTKTGLDYFPFDVDFFADEKIAAISGEFGIKGEITVVKLLCAVYRNGYFILWNEPLKYKLLRDLPSVNSELIDQIVNRLVRWGFFDEGLFDSVKVLTSRGIQKRYFSISRRRNTTDGSYILIPDVKNGVSDDKKEVIDDKNTGAAELLTTETPQSKGKEIKENISPSISNEIVSPPIGEPGKTIDSGKKAEQTRIKLSQQEKEKNCGKREKEFYDQLVPWVSVYGPDMIRKFFDYWRERNKSRTKMRFELQPTWDLAGRLRTWEQKQNDYGKRSKTSGSSSEQDDAELMQHIAAGYARGMQERENR